MKNEELMQIIEIHDQWLRGYINGHRANLSGANLSGADLSGADLRYANLSDADLRYADLRYANLSGANLSGANLSGADLRYADLRNVSGNRSQIKSIFVSEQYPITYTADYLQIGCERHKIDEWWGFDDKRIVGMGGKKALEFWCEWKDTIRILIEKSPATPIKGD